MLIDGHCIGGNIDDAFKVFDEMSNSGLLPTIVTYINGLSKKGRVTKAEELASSITNKGLSPDVITYNILIFGFSNAEHGEIQKAIALCRSMLNLGISSDRMTYNSLIMGRLNEGNVEGANVLFNEMIDKGLALMIGLLIH